MLLAQFLALTSMQPPGYELQLRKLDSSQSKTLCTRSMQQLLRVTLARAVRWR